MNTLGIHVLSFIGDYNEQSLQWAVNQAVDCGYGLLEVSIHDPNLDTELLRTMANRAEIELTTSRGLSLDADISNEDSAIARAGFQILESAIATTSELGSTYFGGLPYGALAKYGSAPTVEGRANAVKYMKLAARMAATEGITLGLEVVNRYENNLLNTAEQALAFIDEVGEDNVVVHLDTYHMNIEETDFASPVEACGDRLGYVHVGESNRGYLGTGTVNFEQFFTALKAIGFAGPITFESFSSAVVSEGLSNNLCVWRNLWEDSSDLATKAHAFLVENLK